MPPLRQGSEDGVLRRPGGMARTWRTDRLAPVIVPGTREVQASFAPVAKYYGAMVWGQARHTAAAACCAATRTVAQCYCEVSFQPS